MTASLRARWLCALLVAAVIAVSAPALAAPPPTQDEVKLGRQIAEQIEKRYKVVTDPALNERLQRVTQVLVPVSDRPGVSYSFKILEVDVVNAVALPGGFIYITRPTLDFVRSDHELAAILAHEMVHVAHVHGMEMLRRQNYATLLTLLVAALTRDPNVAQGVQLASVGVLATYTRAMERDADLTAITYLQKTPYAPVGLLTLMEQFERLERYRPSVDLGAWADHPTAAERVKYIEVDLRRRGLPVHRRISANYLRLTVREAKGAPGAELLVNDRLIVRLAGEERLREMAERLDRLFNADLQPFEVSAREAGEQWVVAARGQTIVTLTQQDATWAGTTTKDLAQSVQVRLRAAIDDDIRRRKLSG